MSATPRPLGAYTMGRPGDVVTIEWINKRGTTLKIDQIHFGALGALLAVAKAMDRVDANRTGRHLWSAGLALLDLEHPGWQEW